MSQIYKITLQRPDGVTAVVEADDLRQVLRDLGFVPVSTNGTIGSSSRSETASRSTSQASGSPDEEASVTQFRKLYRMLGSTPRLVLNALCEFPDGATDVQLKEALKSHHITTLAGAMTAIVKGAKRMGIDTEKVIEKENFRNKETGSYFHYRIGSAAREVLSDLKSEMGAD